MTEKQTPKQSAKPTPKAIVLAAYPEAHATQMPDGTWNVYATKTDPNMACWGPLGSNGSATGAWNNAAKRLQERQQTRQIAPNFTVHGYTAEEADNLRQRANATASKPTGYAEIASGKLSAKVFRAKRLAYRAQRRA